MFRVGPLSECLSFLRSHLSFTLSRSNCVLLSLSRPPFPPTYTRTPALNRCAGREVRVGGEVTDAQNTITRVSTTRPPNSRRSEDLLGSANRAHPVGWLFVILLFPFVLLFISLSLFLSLSLSLSLLQPPWAGPERVIHFTFHVHFILRGLASFEKPKLYSYLLCFFVGVAFGATVGSLFLGAHSPSGRRWGARIFRTIRVPHRRQVLSLLIQGTEGAPLFLPIDVCRCCLFDRTTCSGIWRLPQWILVRSYT